MAKSRHGKDEEFHRGIIRELRKEVKNLKQRIRQLERQQNNYYTPQQEKEEIVEKLPKCPGCGKGFLKEIEIVNRVFSVCNLCDYRSKTLKVKRKR